VPTCGKARRWFVRFHGEAPRAGQIVWDPRLGCLAEMGTEDTVVYATRRKGRAGRYEHEWSDDAAPRVMRDDAGQIHRVGGHYRATATRGLVDMPKKKKKGAKHRNPFRSGGSDADMWTYYERVGITGGSAVGANVITKVAAERYLDTWEPKNRNYARAAGQMYLSWKFRRKYPRIMAGVGIGGAIVLAEQLLTSSDPTHFDLEREVRSFIEPRRAGAIEGAQQGRSDERIGVRNVDEHGAPLRRN
jgi:hypothetical protein